MAKGRKPKRPQSLECPLCLDTFQDAKLLSCGHTFCRNCLETYDEGHRHLDHMVCSICRKPTKFSEDRVQGLPPNVTVNGLVDELRTASALPEGFPKCSACDMQHDALMFCYDCDRYMCGDCYSGHKRMNNMFAGHHVVSMKDVGSGKEKIVRHFGECPTHKPEKRKLFCWDCKFHICQKCTAVGHGGYKIKDRHDFRKEMQERVKSLLHRCTEKKNHVERNIEAMELSRCELKSTAEKLKVQIRQAREIRNKQLEQNDIILLQLVEEIENCWEKRLNDSKASQQQMLSRMENLKLLSKKHLGNLEGDSLETHNHLSKKLEDVLGEEVEDTLADQVLNTVKRLQFEYWVIVLKDTITINIQYLIFFGIIFCLLFAVLMQNASTKR